MASTTRTHRIIVWLRTDLRLKDNPVLAEAAARLRAAGAAGGEVVPVYCIDGAAMCARATIDGAGGGRGRTRTELPWMRCSARRAAFQLECVVDLKTRMRELSSDLLVAEGRPEEVIRHLAGHAGRTTVLTAGETAAEEAGAERRVRSAMRAVGGALEVLKGTSSLYDDDDVGSLFGGEDYPGMPDVFTPFRNKLESRLEVRQPIAEPKKGSLPLPKQTSFAEGKYDFAFFPRSLAEVPSLAALLRAEEGNVPGTASHDVEGESAFPFRGGESQGLQRLQHYLWDTDALSTYFETRNGMLGTEYSSKFAPWLSLGCVSPRTIHAEIKKYEASRVSNKSTYWLVFELIWRDFFRFFQRKHGNAIFHERGIMGAGTRLRWRSDAEHAQECLQRWTTGTTGWPLVDANMRELNATGFMSNRGRQNVASFLVLDCGIDWRYGASFFENRLLDYDVYSNWGNWVAAAGLTGGRVNKFNILKQSKDYDAEGRYVRAWLPELKDVPNEYIHEPARMPLALQEQLGVVIGEDYPKRMSASQLGQGGNAFGILGNQQKHSRQSNGNGKARQTAGGGGKGRKSGSFARRNTTQLVPGRH